MARKLIKIFILLLVIALIAMGLIYYALFISINQIDIRYETLSSDKIPDAMNDVKIAYFTDLEYGNFVDEQRLDMIIDKINYAAADVIIFGGDLFDDPGSQLKEEDIKTIQEKLESLDAPLGKFAVLGERDCVNETVREQVSTLLEDADFEILDNRSLHIRNGSNSGIVLIGTQPLINGSPDIDAAVSNITNEEYNIMITHCPDLFTKDNIPFSSLSLGIAGHSHGSQINLPLFGSYNPTEGAKQYSLGKYQVSSMELQVSNGVGTTGVNARLFSPAEIVVYRLQHTE